MRIEESQRQAHGEGRTQLHGLALGGQQRLGSQRALERKCCIDGEENRPGKRHHLEHCRMAGDHCPHSSNAQCNQQGVRQAAYEAKPEDVIADQPHAQDEGVLCTNRNDEGRAKQEAGEQCRKQCHGDQNSFIWP